jgi:hypothetical protein
VKIIVPHRTTVDEAIVMVDRSSDALFEGAGGPAVELVERKRSWNESQMNFSLIARVGFISVPISGTVLVDAVNVTVHCELPALVKTFIGEDKIRAGIESKVRGVLRA